MERKTVIPIVILVTLTMLLGTQFIRFNDIYSNSHGGWSMAEVSSAVIVVNGGNIMEAEFGDLVVWANEPDVLISILGSGTERRFNVTVENVRPNNIHVNGSLTGSMEYGITSISFTAVVAPRLVKDIKLDQTGNLENFSFALLGDSRDNPDVFRQVLKESGDWDPLFIIILGDMVNDGTRKEYDELAGLIERAPAPIFTVPGNHDVKGNGAGYYSQMFGVYYHSFDVDNTHFIMLDNAKGYVDKEQMEWLRQDLEQSNTTSNLVFMHMPPFDPRPGSEHAMTDSANAQDLISIFEQFQVDTVFAAHIHSYFNVTRNGVRYILSGGGGAPLVKDAPGHHYVLVNISHGNITTEIFVV
ncbi:MAG: metallophosphoesterase [ANME-2 cluster archaeon]|nr:metallophosphoesterase [ANME-2 cluster archaeon]